MLCEGIILNRDLRFVAAPHQQNAFSGIRTKTLAGALTIAALNLPLRTSSMAFGLLAAHCQGGAGGHCGDYFMAVYGPNQSSGNGHFDNLADPLLPLVCRRKRAPVGMGAAIVIITFIEKQRKVFRTSAIRAPIDALPAVFTFSLGVDSLVATDGQSA
jgi:hypothetical protein